MAHWKIMSYSVTVVHYICASERVAKLGTLATYKTIPPRKSDDKICSCCPSQYECKDSTSR
ncbi:hypothetical protein BDR07DRAFT_1425544 [Suillus spraguei]|nr:hypothetical protein BDR07DRAFT_1425544 [Suillus spraguei]